MNAFSFDSTGFRIDGKDQYLVSGEFHYFRVPKADWRRRMRLFKEAGGNCLATYVPWLIHEPEEGDIRFGDTDYRDLAGFLSLAQEMGLKVILRPGPYQYSELDNAGLPGWLLRRYPEIMARDAAGNVFNSFAVSYLHPVFLKKARAYYRAFAEQARPFMAENGGPVHMLQVDNELTGVHVWFGSLDYNRETMGFGEPDGRYPRWLQAKYGSVEALNEAYDTRYQSFGEVLPIPAADRKNAASCRSVKDYSDFYLDAIAEYARLLADWLREDGLGGLICHNSANPGMNALFPETVKAMGGGFLLSSDHYYTLNQSWEQNNPTPQYCLRVMMSCDMLRALGMPPAVLELPGGSPSDTPPILPEDLLCCYMSNLALGIKGLNYYVYTGGPNAPDTGTTCDVYDYNALVRADGSLNDTYAVAKQFGGFMAENGWLQRARRVASVQVGFEWNALRSRDYDFDLPYGGAAIARFLEKGALYTLMCSRFSPEMVSMDGALSVDRPLILPCPSAMSAGAQDAALDFVKRGGRLMLLPAFPETDPDFRPLSRWGDALGRAAFTHDQPVGPAIEVEDVGRVFGINRATVCNRLPDNARAIAFDARAKRVLGFELRVGKGTLIWFGGLWEMSGFPQAQMMERFLEKLGAKPCVSSSNRNVFTALWTDDNGRRMLFALNPYSGAQRTRLHVFEGGELELEEMTLRPMEVRSVSL
ncbi:MAG: beta-galactosidase [Clostridia bacterium]|nr:beta-galactosidase [Clostridia bacterium]